MMALGMLLPSLAVLGLTEYAWTAAAIVTATAALLALSGWNLAARVGILGVMGATVCVWVATGGWQLVGQIVTSAVLQINGLTAALPLVGAEASVLLALLAALYGFLLTLRGGFGSLGAVVLTGLMAVAMWATGHGGQMLLLAPAMAGAAVLVARDVQRDELQPLRLLPWTTLIAVLACLLVPSGGVTVAPMKESADELRQRIYDYFFFNQPRNVFSLANEGLYPQGIGQLGGAAKPTGHPVMIVQTDRTAYLRGAIKDTYTGRIWLDTIGSKRYLWMAPNQRLRRDGVFDAALPPQGLLSDTVMPLHQMTVTMLDRSASSLFVPQRIRSLTVGGDLVPYFNDASEIFVTRDLAKDDTYTVTAPLAVAGAAGLETIINACAAAGDPAYDRISGMYTALPDHMQSQVFSLAHTAAQGAETPYQKALAVQNYLRRSFQYTLNAEYQPSNVDFVANFLLNTKAGYCTYFASAMTVMCRMLGIPARYVEGYMAEPDSAGRAYVTGKDAHAWTEVYLAGYGWLTFDATPADHTRHQDDPQDDEQDDNKNNNDQEDEEQEDEEEPEDDPEDDPEDEPEQNDEPAVYVDPATDDHPDDPDDPDDPPKPDFGWLKAVLFLLLLLLLIAAAAWRIRQTLPQTMAAVARDDEARWQVWTQAVHDQLRVLGRKRLPGESPLCYFCRLADEPALPDLLALLGEMENYVAYGRYIPQASEAEDARQICMALQPCLKRTQQLKLLLLRAFVPVKRRDWTAN